MKNTIIAAVLLVGTSVSPLLAQTTDEFTELKQRVAQLEKQLQEISQLVGPLKAQQSQEKRRTALNAKFQQKMAQDRQKYSAQQLSDAESLYQVANQKWGTPEANESLKSMIEKYPDINRTGCAVLYIGQKSEGEARTKYLQDCIDKYDDCFYGDGVQVGAYARFLLAGDYLKRGEQDKAVSLYNEIKTKYPEAIDHSGNLLVDSIKLEDK